AESCHKVRLSNQAVKKLHESGDLTVDPDEIVTIYRTGNAALASILADALNDEGIQARIDSPNQAALPGVIDSNVLIKAKDVDRAIKIINEHPHTPRDNQARHPWHKHHS